MDPEAQKKILSMAETLGVKAEELFGVLVREAVAYNSTMATCLFVAGLGCLILAALCALRLGGRDLYWHGDTLFPPTAGVVAPLFMAFLTLGFAISHACEAARPNSAAIRAILGK